jgi:hypothetical protein
VVDQVWFEPPHRHATLRRHPLHEVAIGREVGGVDDDLVAVRPKVAGSVQHLEEVDRRGVGDDRLARGSAEHDGGDLVAHRDRQLDPALVPAPDESLTPAVGDERRQHLGGRPRRATEGVPVEVRDDVARGQEALAKGSEWIGGVECGDAHRQLT